MNAFASNVFCLCLGDDLRIFNYFFLVSEIIISFLCFSDGTGVCSMDYGSQDEKKDLEVHFYTELYEKKVRKLAIKNQECRPKLLEMIERIATIKPQNLAQRCGSNRIESLLRDSSFLMRSICPHLSHQKYKEGYLLASTGAPERPSVKSRCYCAHGKMHWYDNQLLGTSELIAACVRRSLYFLMLLG